jgi:hypothetical protein
MNDELAFAFRSRILGKLKFRSSLPKLPKIQECPDLQKEQFYYSHIIKAAIPSEKAATIRHVIDIGCRNWTYASSLAASFPNAALTGIELDGFRRYWNLYRRIDYAYAHANALKDTGKKVEVLHADFHNLSFELSTMAKPLLWCFLFPFVSQRPCKKWGLPSRFADFSSLLEHSIDLSTGNASLHPSHSEHSQTAGKILWLSVHQGEWEAEIARSIYQRLGFSIREKIISPQEWVGIWPSSYESWIFQCNFSDV